MSRELWISWSWTTPQQSENSGMTFCRMTAEVHGARDTCSFDTYCRVNRHHVYVVSTSMAPRSSSLHCEHGHRLGLSIMNKGLAACAYCTVAEETKLSEGGRKQYRSSATKTPSGQADSRYST
eukprot:TRINITY_DN48714_c0_g1_i1.p1 TRINITY_DN48714_c0_g1~~TRINITY_DN48714_c0_g1_i1.p1  ORF type:complete len:123 (-),score=9.31 TRINITY_DN48714_c0_g1_i1:12-380(-)